MRVARWASFLVEQWVLRRNRARSTRRRLLCKRHADRRLKAAGGACDAYVELAARHQRTDAAATATLGGGLTR